MRWQPRRDFGALRHADGGSFLARKFHLPGFRPNNAFFRSGVFSMRFLPLFLSAVAQK
jgi:hypothetical protein